MTRNVHKQVEDFYMSGQDCNNKYHSVGRSKNQYHGDAVVTCEAVRNGSAR